MHTIGKAIYKTSLSRSGNICQLRDYTQVKKQGRSLTPSDIVQAQYNTVYGNQGFLYKNTTPSPFTSTAQQLVRHRQPQCFQISPKLFH